MADDRAGRRLGGLRRRARDRRHAGALAGTRRRRARGPPRAHRPGSSPIIVLAVVAVGIAIAYRMYGSGRCPTTAPAGVSALTVAARQDLYGTRSTSELFMRPGQLLTEGLVWVDDTGRRGRERAGRAGRPHLGRLAAAADRLRPLLRAVDVGGRGPGRRRDPGGATVVTSMPLADHPVGGPDARAPRW